MFCWASKITSISVALSFLSLSSVHAQTDQIVSIEVRQTASGEDDYLCWTPVLARARLVNSAPTSLQVSLHSVSDGNGGELFFSRFPGFVPLPADFEHKSEVAITLPKDGSWVPFLVAGSKPSVNGKDVSIIARALDAEEPIGRTKVMVRVRKNAESLTPFEKQRFLEALARLHGHQRPVGPTNNYEKYAIAHGRAFRFGIHGGNNGLPLFLAWHRAFLLSLEREIQEIDPTVTLPYWRFDEDSSAIFTPEFLGQVAPGSAQVRFINSNPLRGWRMGSGGPLVRNKNPTVKLQDIYPSFQFQKLSDIMTKPNAVTYGGAVSGRGINGEIEARHHNYAHVDAGGWVTSGTSPRDPLFFLLHTNVDRAWAEWQQKFSRFDPDAVESYPLQGAYPGTAETGRLRYGSYSEDEMWPWSQETGASTPGDPLDDWPTAGFAFPQGVEGGSALIPTPKSMIDYLNKNGNSIAHNVCYDELGYTE